MSEPKPDFTLNLTPELRRTIVEFLADTAIYAFAQGAQATEERPEDHAEPKRLTFADMAPTRNLASVFPPEPEGPASELELEVQALMEPDKHGNHTRPARTAFLGDTFARPIQRTLDALWKFAEQTREWVSEACVNWKAAEVRVDSLVRTVTEQRAVLDTMDECIENARMEGYRAAMNDKLNGGLQDMLDEERAKERLRLADAIGLVRYRFALTNGETVDGFRSEDIDKVLEVKP